MAVLQTVTPTNSEALLAAAMKRIEELEAMASKRAHLTFKIGDKGALSVYGLGRFPITAYIGQWERLWAAQDDMKVFAKANASKLARKE